jgi:NADH-quinone oxidoreductase subunit E
MVQKFNRAEEIVNQYGSDKSALIQVLLELQKENNWLSEDALKLVSNKLDIPLTRVYHAATFYKAFSLAPRGRHTITVCLGTACHVREASRLLDKVVNILKIRPGQTSADMRFTLQTVNCLGCCAIGPVMVIDDNYYCTPTAKEIEQVTALYQ